MTEPDQTESDRETWYSGPADPEELKDYFEWLLEDHDGQLVESPIGEDYYVEVTRLEEDGEETLRSVEGARIVEADRDE